MHNYFHVIWVKENEVDRNLITGWLAKCSERVDALKSLPTIQIVRISQLYVEVVSLCQPQCYETCVPYGKSVKTAKADDRSK